MRLALRSLPICNSYAPHAMRLYTREMRVLAGWPKKCLIAHLAQVNAISDDEALQLINEAFGAWHNLQSASHWQVSVASTVLDRFPDLVILDGATI
jgi:hypothetical protein